MWMQFKFFCRELISSSGFIWTPRSRLLRISGMSCFVGSSRCLIICIVKQNKTNEFQVFTVIDLFSEQNICPNGQGS